MLRAEMSLCERYQISHSHFLGGPAVWTDLDRAKAKMYRAFMNEACPDCGTRASEWDPKTGGHRDAYVADFTYCQGCSRLNDVKDAAEDTDRKKGIHYHLVDREAWEQRQDEQEAAERAMQEAGEQG